MLVIVQNGKLDRAGIRIVALSISVYRKSISKIIALIISGMGMPVYQAFSEIIALIISWSTLRTDSISQTEPEGMACKQSSF